MSDGQIALATNVFVRMLVDVLKAMPPLVRANALWELRFVLEREEPAVHRSMPSSVRWRTRLYQWVREQRMGRAQFHCENCGGNHVLQLAHDPGYPLVGTFDEVEHVRILCRSCHAQEHGMAA